MPTDFIFTQAQLCDECRNTRESNAMPVPLLLCTAFGKNEANGDGSFTVRKGIFTGFTSSLPYPIASSLRDEDPLCPLFKVKRAPAHAQVMD